MKPQIVSQKKQVQINLNLSKSLNKRLEKCKEDNVFYGVFPIKGNSMECEDINKCIPDGSKVLAIDTQLKLSSGLHNIWHEVPRDKPLLIIGETSSGSRFFICKTIASIDAVQGVVKLKSYNNDHAEKWIPFSWISNIFEVVQIID